MVGRITMGKFFNEVDDIPVITGEMLAAHFDEKDLEKVSTKPKTKTPKEKAAPTPAVVTQKQAVAQETSAVRASLNKRTLATRDRFDAIVEKYGDPLEELARIAHEKQQDDQGNFYHVNPVEVRVKVLIELAGYGHSKLKTIEHTGANGEPLEFKMNIVQNILQMMKPDEPRTITDAE
jgi:hypothetical protein